MSLVTERPRSRATRSASSRVDSALLVGRSEELVGALVRLERLDRVRVVRDVGLAADQRLVLVLGDASDLHLWRDRKEKAHAARVACRRRW